MIVLSLYVVHAGLIEDLRARELFCQGSALQRVIGQRGRVEGTGMLSTPPLIWWSHADREEVFLRLEGSHFFLGMTHLCSLPAKVTM